MVSNTIWPSSETTSTTPRWMKNIWGAKHSDGWAWWWGDAYNARCFSSHNTRFSVDEKFRKCDLFFSVSTTTFKHKLVWTTTLFSLQTINLDIRLKKYHMKMCVNCWLVVTNNFDQQSRAGWQNQRSQLWPHRGVGENIYIYSHLFAEVVFLHDVLLAKVVVWFDAHG